MSSRNRPRSKNFIRSIKKPDFILLAVVILLSLFGILFVYDASVIEAYRSFSDKFFFVKQQLVWTMIGLFLAFTLSLVPYQVYKKFGVWFFILSIFLLIIVLLPMFGTKTLGAKRWISLGSMRLQPAELTKLALVMYLASFLEKKRNFAQISVIVAVVAGLVMLEPDLGTTVVLSSIAAGMYFLSGAPLLSFVILGVAGILMGSLFILTSEYRKARVETFLNPMQDPLGASYHIRQVLIALGSGGILGLGIGKSRQKYAYIPAATTDSIFAIIAEEIGFLGSLIIIFLFFTFIIRAFRIAKRAPDSFGQLLAGGIAVWLSVQTLLNLATMVALVPLTGVPLPFISYGGSSTVTNLAGVGVLLNISRYARKK